MVSTIHRISGNISIPEVQREQTFVPSTPPNPKASVHCKVLANINLTITIRLCSGWFVLRREVMTDIDKYILFSFTWVSVLEQTSMLACREFRSHAIGKARLVIPNRCSIVSDPWLHVCQVVERLKGVSISVNESNDFTDIDPF